MNPVRAGKVESITDYLWSSYHHNALAELDALITEHPLNKDLGKTPERGCLSYRELFDQPVNQKEDSQIAEATMKNQGKSRGQPA